jgi:hypothetical protein
VASALDRTPLRKARGAVQAPLRGRPAAGRITLHAVDYPEYAQLSIDPSLTQLCAMRSSRAAG